MGLESCIYCDDIAIQKDCLKVSIYNIAMYYWTFVFKIGHHFTILHQKS